jgi:hypothetical protein
MAVSVETFCIFSKEGEEFFHITTGSVQVVKSFGLYLQSRLRQKYTFRWVTNDVSFLYADAVLIKFVTPCHTLLKKKMS